MNAYLPSPADVDVRGESSAAIGVKLRQLRAARHREFMTNIVPQKKRDCEHVYDYITGCVPRLGEVLCEHIFRDATHVTGDTKTQAAFRAARSKRIRKLARLTYARAEKHEQQRIERYAKHLEWWLTYVQASARLFEIMRGLPHPSEYVELPHSERMMIKPELRCQYDEILEAKIEDERMVELDGERYGWVDVEEEDKVEDAGANAATGARQRRPRRRTIDDGSCRRCGARESHIKQMGSGYLTCTSCGLMSDVPLADEVDPFANVSFGRTFTTKQRPNYSATQNFVKKLDSLQGLDANRVPREVIEYCRKNVPRDRVTYTNVERCLSQGGYAHYYQSIPAIMWYIAGIEPLDLSDYRAQLIEMHELYMRAFKACPLKIRKRTSTLFNSYLIFKFLQMLGLYEYLSRVPQLKGKQKIREHDRTMRVLVVYVRENLIPEHERDECVWYWVDTPLVVE